MAFLREDRAWTYPSTKDFSDTKPLGSEMGLDADYRQLVADQLTRLGIPTHVVAIDVLTASKTPDGHELFVVMLKVIEWDREAAVRLLLAQGFLEAGIRRAIASTWLPEVSTFGGVWLRVSARLQSGAPARELKRILRILNGMAGGCAAASPADEAQIARSD